MRWWLKTHRAVLSLAGVLMLGLLAIFSTNLTLSFPALTGGIPFASTPAPTILDLLAVLVCSVVIQHAHSVILDASVRNMAALNALVYLGALAMMLLAYVIGLAIGIEGGQLAALLKMFLGYLALVVLGRAVGLGWIASVLPILYLFASGLFGRGSDGDVHAWAWAVRITPRSTQVVMALVALAVVVLAATMVRRRPLITVRNL